MATKMKLTEARVREAEPGTYADTEENGLMLYVSPTSRTFGLYKWSPTLKKPVTKSIGKWPLVSVDEARKRAKALALKLLDGVSLSRPDTVSVKDLVDRYCRWNRTRDLKYPDWIESVIASGFADWLNRDISTIARSEIAERHLDISSEAGPGDCRPVGEGPPHALQVR